MSLHCVVVQISIVSCNSILLTLFCVNQYCSTSFLVAQKTHVALSDSNKFYKFLFFIVQTINPINSYTSY